MTETNELIPAFTESLADDSLMEAAKEIAQFGVDAVIKNEELKHFPVVKLIFAVGATVGAVRDIFLVSKILKCFSAMQDVSADAKRRMIASLEADASYGRRVGEQLIELLDRIESHRKPAMVGTAFAAYARGEIDSRMLQRLLESIERLPLVELDIVRKFGSIATPVLADEGGFTGFDAVSLQAMVSSGLATSQSGWGALTYQRTSTCEAFIRLELDKKE